MQVNKLTKDQAKIISAYTGYLLGRFSDMHEYVEQLLGRPVFTHEMANEELAKQIREKAKNDFISLSP